MAALATIRLSAHAEEDIAAILSRTERVYGKSARLLYEALIVAGLRDIASDPLRPGSKARPEIGRGVRTYHLRHTLRHTSLRSKRKGASVREPRHFLLYRSISADIIGVGRVLHDAMDINLHIPTAYGDED